MEFCTAKWIILPPVCISGRVIQLARASTSGHFKKEMQRKGCGGVWKKNQQNCSPGAS